MQHLILTLHRRGKKNVYTAAELASTCSQAENTIYSGPYPSMSSRVYHRVFMIQTLSNFVSYLLAVLQIDRRNDFTLLSLLKQYHSVQMGIYPNLKHVAGPSIIILPPPPISRRLAPALVSLLVLIRTTLSDLVWS